MSSNNVEAVAGNNSRSLNFAGSIGRILNIVTSWAVGIIFLNSGLQKIFLPYKFLAIVYGYELTTPLQGYSVAFVVPWLELTLGVILISGRLRLAAWLLVVIMLAIFVCVRLQVLWSGLVVQCGCYGLSDEVVNWQNTGITIAILIVSIIALYTAYIEQCKT
jgi:uncharacterized membrane protein YphA (DoxX/SURF4 family)